VKGARPGLSPPTQLFATRSPFGVLNAAKAFWEARLILQRRAAGQRLAERDSLGTAAVACALVRRDRTSAITKKRDKRGAPR
jgi:hypothetical protein